MCFGTAVLARNSVGPRVTPVSACEMSESLECVDLRVERERALRHEASLPENGGLGDREQFFGRKRRKKGKWREGPQVYKLLRLMVDIFRKRDRRFFWEKRGQKSDKKGGIILEFRVNGWEYLQIVPPAHDEIERRHCSFL